MNKIATNITIFASMYFGKQRPFEVLKGSRVVKKPSFPNIITIRGADPRALREEVKSSVITSCITKPLFIEGDDYRAGIYYGDVYEIPDRKYYLFRIVREPVKQLILPDPVTQMTSYIKLMIQSPGGRLNNIQIKRRGTWQEDIEETEKRITSLMASMPTLEDKATESLETYIRAYYAMQKIASVGGGNNSSSFRILPLKS